MAGTQGNDEKFNLTLRVNGVSRDLVDKLITSGFDLNAEAQQGENDEQMELDLRLLLKGKFEVDPAMRSVRRASSISNLVFTVDTVAENGGGAHQESSGSRGRRGGSSGNGVGNNPSRIQSVSIQIEKEPSVRATGPIANGGNEVHVNNSLLDMPLVSTRRNGANGEKVDGILYKYRRLEEVCIVCFCHGRFFSPAEFVRHGGGGDVDEPLKHIIITQLPSSFTTLS